MIPKELFAILMLVLLSCKGGNYPVAEANKKEVLVYYSKRPCPGTCPVYDFWIFTDGTLLYRAVGNKTASKKRIRGLLGPKELIDLKFFLDKNLGYPKLLRPIRDMPKTVLRFDDREYEYYAARVSGSLKTVNARMEGLVDKLLKNENTNGWEKR